MEHGMKKEPRNNRRKTRGMTLVEVSMAIGIASFAAISIIGTFSIFLSNSADSTERSIISRIYRSTAESVKLVAAQTPATQEWRASFAFTRDIIACELNDTTAHYLVEGRGSPTTSLPGISSTNAWAVEIKIFTIPRNQIVLHRSIVLVKEPSAGNSSSQLP